VELEIAPKSHTTKCGPELEQEASRKESIMKCPFCQNDDSRVIDSRSSDEGLSTRRRRECPECSRRFTTNETITLNIVKRNGVAQSFSRDKVIAGVRRACQGRPVTEDDLAILAAQVEENLRASGQAEVPSNEVGLAILGPLRELDEVAYLRFASVYRSFESIADFELEIEDLRSEPSKLKVSEKVPEKEPAT
jgi:transcriptional repressor NrdR